MSEFIFGARKVIYLKHAKKVNIGHLFSVYLPKLGSFGMPADKLVSIKGNKVRGISYAPSKNVIIERTYVPGEDKILVVENKRDFWRFEKNRTSAEENLWNKYEKILEASN